ncbi:MAG TPA: roadblock/LC7 domain-containing protein [Syntrophobacteraceae bacterium]|nr:roadblock/LC7 domain-containing protein [Syntrophobacteraceae bacterium]
MSLILTKGEVDQLDKIVRKELLDAGANHVMIVDMAGNLILERGSLHMNDILALAVLSAANFAATAQIARLIGEEDFTLLFHKGDKRNIHFSRLDKEYILVTLFDENVSLGLIRLRSGSAVEQLLNVFNK